MLAGIRKLARDYWDDDSIVRCHTPVDENGAVVSMAALRRGEIDALPRLCLNRTRHVSVRCFLHRSYWSVEELVASANDKYEDDARADLVERFGWTDEQVARLRAMRGDSAAPRDTRPSFPFVLDARNPDLE